MVCTYPLTLNSYCYVTIFLLTVHVAITYLWAPDARVRVGPHCSHLIRYPTYKINPRGSESCQFVVAMYFNNFLPLITTPKLIQSLRKFQQLVASPTPTLPPSPPPPSTTLDIDQRPTTEAAEQNPQMVAYPAARQHNRDRTMSRWPLK